MTETFIPRNIQNPKNIEVHNMIILSLEEQYHFFKINFKNCISVGQKC